MFYAVLAVSTYRPRRKIFDIVNITFNVFYVYYRPRCYIATPLATFCILAQD